MALIGLVLTCMYTSNESEHSRTLRPGRIKGGSERGGGERGGGGRPAQSQAVAAMERMLALLSLMASRNTQGAQALCFAVSLALEDFTHPREVR